MSLNNDEICCELAIFNAYIYGQIFIGNNIDIFSNWRRILKLICYENSLVQSSARYENVVIV